MSDFKSKNVSLPSSLIDRVESWMEKEHIPSFSNAVVRALESVLPEPTQEDKRAAQRKFLEERRKEREARNARERVEENARREAERIATTCPSCGDTGMGFSRFSPDKARCLTCGFEEGLRAG